MRARASKALGRIDLSVRRALREVAAKWSARGVELVVFGSFAGGSARPNSDLDLAYRLKDEHADAIRELRKDIESLPTIRTIDLVNTLECGAELRREILDNGVPLKDCLSD